MIYPDSFEHKTGFDTVRTDLAALCASALGSNCVEAMAFSTDHDLTTRRLRQTAEMVAIIASGSSVPVAGIRDVTQRLRAIRAEGTFIPATELPELRSSLATIGELIALLTATAGDSTSDTPLHPELATLAGGMTTFPAIVALIDHTVDRWGNVADKASPQLADIRRQMVSTQASIGTVMRRIIATAARDGYLDPDTSAAVRDGRPVIPIAPMYKRKIAGIVHDESASGKTCYIEPAEVVEANNRLRQLQLDERREITRILIAVADQIRPHIDSLLDAHHTLGLIDFIHAKALYARLSGGTLPRVQPSPDLEWYHACHPVLRASLERQGKSIVPLDISLTPDRRILVISGPNAGGKSVTLKTVAIVQYMMQCGMLPPLYDNSCMGMFDSLFIDIGDDQSIEDDLSTYSSHLRNMRQLVTRGDSRTLILIDEFGSGTEPTIGGAIAQALLGRFVAIGMWGVITTHFQNLKEFAEVTDGLVNGSMLYDRQHMKPLFSLSIGTPGSSFALEIARQTGLPDDIIATAKEIVGSDYVNLDRYLSEIARDRRYWENKRQAIRQKEKRIDQVLDRYEQEADNLRSRSREIISDARQQAQRILDDSNAAVERTIRDIRSAQADRDLTRQARLRLATDKARLTGTEPGTDAHADEHTLLARAPRRKKPAKAPERPAEQPIKAGDNVLLDGQGLPGRVLDISGANATVAFGQMRTTVKLTRLKHTLRQPPSAQSQQAASFVSRQTTDSIRQRQLEFRNEIDVRGMRADEAVQAVTYFIDDAVQFASQRVRILHGTGTGALRQYIRQYLSTVNAVRSYHDEDVRFGGAGITVVEF